MNDRRLRWYFTGLLFSLLSVTATLLLDTAAYSTLAFLPVLLFFLGCPVIGLLNRWHQVPSWYVPFLAFLLGATLTAVIAVMEMSLFSTTVWTVLIASLMAALLNGIQLFSTLRNPSSVDLESTSTVPRDRKRLVAASCFLILLILASYTAIQPFPAKNLTEFYILNEEGRASDYPAHLTVGDNVGLTLGIANHEGRLVEYHVQIWLAQMSVANDPNSTQAMYYLDTISIQLNDTSMTLDGQWRPQHELDYNLTIPIDGSLRLWFFLFFDEVPDGSEELISMTDYWGDDYWDAQMRSLIGESRSNQVLSLSIQLSVASHARK